MAFYSLSPPIISVISLFCVLFSVNFWRLAISMLLGAIVGKDKRTISNILRILGLDQEAGYSKFHRILSSLEWSSKQGNMILLGMLLKAYMLSLVSKSCRRMRKNENGFNVV